MDNTPATKNDVREIVTEVITQIVPKMITEAITTSVPPIVHSIVNDAIAKNNVYLTEVMKTEVLQIYKILAEHDEKFDKINENANEMKKELKADIHQSKRELAQKIEKVNVEVSIIRGYKEMVENHRIRLEKLEETVFPGKAA